MENLILEKLEKVRADHNGVFGIQLFLGHDGHHSCEFRDYDKRIAKGEGSNLSADVERCLAVWQPQRLDELQNARDLAKAVIASPAHEQTFGNATNALAQAVLDLADEIERLKARRA